MAEAKDTSKAKLWMGWISTGIPSLMLIFSGVLKFMDGPELDQGFAHLGWPVSLAIPLAILELSCVVIYLIPRSAVLGAILVTGYMGGAIATHVRVGDPYYIQALLGVFVWLGLYLRDPRLKALLPFVR